MNPETFAYRRVIMIGGIFGIIASLGFGRFTLGMMLPALGDALTLSYSQMGSVGTINFCGYLGAVLLCGIISAWPNAGADSGVYHADAGPSASCRTFAACCRACIHRLFWSCGVVPAIMAALISDYAGPRLATAMFGLVTFFFGIGQIGGPWVAGILAESSGSLVAGFLLAGVLTLIAAGTSVLLPQRKPLN